MIILAIIIFLIIFLYFGVRISLIYNKTGAKLEGCLQISVLRKIKVYSSDFSSSSPKKVKETKEETAEEKTTTEDKDRDKKEIFELVKPCFGDLKTFLKSFMKCIRIENLENHIIFGMSSYTDTAKYIGYIWSVIVIVNSSHENAKLSAVPSFNGSILDGKGVNELEINILKLIPAVLKLVLKKEVRTLIKGVM